MPFLAAPYQQDDHSLPQRLPLSRAAWHGPRLDSGIDARACRFCRQIVSICRQFVDKKTVGLRACREVQEKNILNFDQNILKNKVFLKEICKSK
jgi:hypothetical protein